MYVSGHYVYRTLSEKEMSNTDFSCKELKGLLVMPLTNVPRKKSRGLSPNSECGMPFNPAKTVENFLSKSKTKLTKL